MIIIIYASTQPYAHILADEIIELIDNRSQRLCTVCVEFVQSTGRLLERGFVCPASEVLLIPPFFSFTLVARIVGKFTKKYRTTADVRGVSRLTK